MGDNSGSREPNPQAVSALTGFDPGRGMMPYFEKEWVELRDKLVALIQFYCAAADEHGNITERVLGAPLAANAILDLPEMKEAVKYLIDGCMACEDMRG